MNADDKLREILAAEVEAVEPGAEGWQRIQTGIAARRRRTAWLRGGLVAATTMSVVAAAALISLDGEPRTIAPATPAPSASAAASPSPPSSPSASASPTPSPTPRTTENRPLDVVWPFTDAARLAEWQTDRGSYGYLTDPVRTAEAFGTRFLGMPNATATRLADGRYELRRTAEGGEQARVTVLTMRRIGDAWLVERADKGEAVEIAEPTPGSIVTSPLEAEGPYREADPAFQVQLRGPADSRGTAPTFAEAPATTRPPMRWSARLSYTTTRGLAGSLVVTNGSALDGLIGTAVVIPVRFSGGTGGQVTTPAPDTFYGVDDRQVAVFTTGTGRPISYLTPEKPGGGSYDPALTEDRSTVVYAQGGGTCSASIEAVGAGGGEPRTLVPADRGATFGPALAGNTLAFALVHCLDGGDAADLVVRDLASGRERTVRIRGSFVGRVSLPDSTANAVYLGAEGTTTTIRIVDLAADATLSERLVAAPAGCAWTAVTQRKTGAGAAEIVAAAECGGTRRVLVVDPAGGRHRTLVDLPYRATWLDFDASGRHLLVGAVDGDTNRVLVWSGSGDARVIATGPQFPTW